VDDRAGAVRIILRSFLRRGGDHGRIIRPAGFDLFDAGDAHEPFEIEGHAVQDQHRHIAGVEMLVLGPERDLQRAAFVPVEALAIDDAEAFAFEDVHRLFAMPMLAGVPPNRNFRLQHVAAHGRETELVRDHELDFRIMGGRHPGNVLVACHQAGGFEFVLDLVGGLQPFVVEILALAMMVLLGGWEKGLVGSLLRERIFLEYL